MISCPLCPGEEGDACVVGLDHQHLTGSELQYKNCSMEPEIPWEGRQR